MASLPVVEGEPVRILLLEDSEIDAELLRSHLEKARLSFEVDHVVDRAGFVAALRAGEIDIVLADYSLPDFDGLSALTLSRELRPELPFIFVSGVVGEEFATNALKRGATDYVMKRSLTRLATAVERAVAEARERAERERIAEALKETELSGRLAVAVARLGMWDFHPRSGALVWDQRTKALFGLPPDAAVTLDTFFGGCHPEDRERMGRAIADATSVENDADFSDEYRTVAPDGRVRWLATLGRALFENGACVRFIGVVRDITEQKRSEAELRRLNERLEQNVEERTQERDRVWRISQELFAVATLDGYLKTINPAWTNILGHDERTLLSRPFIDFVHPEDVAATQAVMAKLREGRATPRFENRFRGSDGQWRWIAWTATPAGELIYAVGRDVTEDKLAARALTEAHEALVAQVAERERVEETLRKMQRLEAVGQLTSGVAHDFNNLLTVIIGNLGFLERAAGGDERLKARIEMIRLAADRGASLTAQLLAFSRRQRLEPKPVDLNETVRGMRRLLNSTLGGSVRIETVLKDELWPALVDPTQIELIILNLAINARDAMEVGGSLTLETSNVVRSVPAERPEEPGPGDYVMLAVTDTGPGMPAEVMARAFEPFFTTKPVGHGSGLGLAQVYGFAKQSGGGVRIDTRLGEGTSVKVYLPRAAGEALVEDAAADVPAANPDAGGRLILLVDDDSGVREVTSAMLQDAGYRVIEAGSGGSALEVLRRRPNVEMLIADYAMPGMNGAETTREARRLRPTLPILFITGYADLAELKEVGDERIVQKPFRDGELPRKVQGLFAAADALSAKVKPLVPRR